MPKYHYNVHVISKTDDFSMWVGITLDSKQLPQGTLCLDNSLLGMTAIARARELCPALKECFCEEWNGGDEVEDEEDDPVQKFLGDDYMNKNADFILNCVKDALKAIGIDNVCVSVDEDNNQLIVVYHSSSNGYPINETGISPDDVNLTALRDGLDILDVGYDF